MHSYIHVLCMYKLTFFSARELLSNKLSDWNIGLIVVGAILFVVGLGLAVAMVVLLILRIKASCMLLTINVYVFCFDWDDQDTNTCIVSLHTCIVGCVQCTNMM